MTPSYVVLNCVPLDIIIEDVDGTVPSALLTFLRTIFALAVEAFSEDGTNPKSFALDTTFFLICAESKNNSEAAMLVLTAPICDAYARRSIKIDRVAPSKL